VGSLVSYASWSEISKNWRIDKEWTGSGQGRAQIAYRLHTGFFGFTSKPDWFGLQLNGAEICSRI